MNFVYRQQSLNFKAIKYNYKHERIRFFKMYQNSRVRCRLYLRNDQSNLELRADMFVVLERLIKKI